MKKALQNGYGAYGFQQAASTRRPSQSQPDHAVVEQLAKIAHIDIAKSVRILDRMVRGDREGWRIHGWRESAKKILEQAMKTCGEAREQAKSLIDYLGRRGYTEFGKLLEE